MQRADGVHAAHDIAGSDLLVSLRQGTHHIGVAEDGQGLLEASEVIRADEHRRRSPVASDDDTFVLALDAIDEVREAVLDVAQGVCGHGHDCATVREAGQPISAPASGLTGGRSVARAPTTSRGSNLPEDALLVVRGDDLDPTTARHQARTFRQRFAEWERWGLSAFYARSDAEVDDLAADQLERFPVLVVFRMNELADAGFEVVPTFRTPHVTIAFSGDLDASLDRLIGLGHDRRSNPYHEAEPPNRLGESDGPI